MNVGSILIPKDEDSTRSVGIIIAEKDQWVNVKWFEANGYTWKNVFVLKQLLTRFILQRVKNET